MALLCSMPLAEIVMNPAATAKSYELIARNVMPALNDSNRARKRSMEWATKNAQTFMPAMAGGIEKAITEYEKDRAQKGGEGTAWVNDDVVARATIVRVVVETDRFLDRVTGGAG